MDMIVNAYAHPVIMRPALFQDSMSNDEWKKEDRATFVPQ
jgi:hypothetical protein